MSVNGNLNWIVNFIWGIANDVLRDVYVRGKYRDVILPMTVIRRLDVVLEPSKQEVLRIKKMLDDAGIVNQDAALQQAAGQAFYNTSPFTLRDLRARSRAHQLKADFEAYLDGFSDNVVEIMAPLPDFQFIVDGGGFQALRDFNYLVIASPNLRDLTQTFLAVEYKLSQQEMMAGLQRAAEGERGLPAQVDVG